MLPKIIITNAQANNLQDVSVVLEFGKLTVCAGVSGSGKSSFAFDTLVKKQDCQLANYPRSVKTISQRVSSTSEKLAAIDELADTKDHLIVIDEPLAGTTAKEAVAYSQKIKSLAAGNIVVVVEHRREIFVVADKVLMFGPGSGTNGGNIVATMDGGKYLGSLKSPTCKRVQNLSRKKISAKYSEFWGQKNCQVEININCLTCVTGQCGSGKSRYLEAIFRAFDKSVNSNERRRNLVEVKNKSYIRRPHIIDATPVTKNSRSTVATYYGVSKFFSDQDLNITVDEAMDLYQDDHLITRRLQHLVEIGLGYLKLNQPSFTLSGGECQRIKLAKMLCKKLGNRSIYIFDNPVRGLGEENIAKVMISFDKLVKKNNTVLIAENDPLALRYVDQVIKLRSV